MSATGRTSERGAGTGRRPPLIVHVIHRLAVGGLENGLVNLINEMPPERYRHAIVCMTGFTAFAERLRRDDVPIFALHKRPGQDLGLYWRLYRLLRQLRPAIVHTRNIGTLECVVPAALAGIPVRIHGEHGRDIDDLHGQRRRHLALRRALRPLVTRHVGLSMELRDWLVASVGVREDRVVQLYNGVDLARFGPQAQPPARTMLPVGFGEDAVVFGTVGRLKGEKDPLNLVRAFEILVGRYPDQRPRLRLVLVGDGPLRAEVEARVAAAGLAEQVWIAGERDDVARLLAELDVFVLPSLGEGISNTILEAMASGLPVVATRVGGNPELVEHGRTGELVPAADPQALADAMEGYAFNPVRRRAHGRSGRERVEKEFSLPAMVERYLDLYDGVLSARESAARGNAHSGSLKAG